MNVYLKGYEAGVQDVQADRSLGEKHSMEFYLSSVEKVENAEYKEGYHDGVQAVFDEPSKQVA